MGAAEGCLGVMRLVDCVNHVGMCSVDVLILSEMFAVVYVNRVAEYLVMLEIAVAVSVIVVEISLDYLADCVVVSAIVPVIYVEIWVIVPVDWLIVLAIYAEYLEIYLAQ